MGMHWLSGGVHGLASDLPERSRDSRVGQGHPRPGSVESKHVQRPVPESRLLRSTQALDVGLAGGNTSPKTRWLIQALARREAEVMWKRVELQERFALEKPQHTEHSAPLEPGIPSIGVLQTSGSSGPENTLDRSLTHIWVLRTLDLARLIERPSEHNEDRDPGKSRKLETRGR